jgi:hypothetical protein
MALPAHSYDESKIKTLSSLEHIRLRPGMYIGRLGNGSNQDDGIYILLKEVVDNAVDEFIIGVGKCGISGAAYPWASWWNAFRLSIPGLNTTPTCFSFPSA